jgi:hypothetical protein
MWCNNFYRFNTIKLVAIDYSDPQVYVKGILLLQSMDLISNIFIVHYCCRVHTYHSIGGGQVNHDDNQVT